MPATYKVLEHKDIEVASEEKQTFAVDVLHGLSHTPKMLVSKYFYDNEGSGLFSQITELPEYYLTKCEFEILVNHKDQIANLVSNESFNLIEMGAGDGRKTNVLLDCFLKKKLDFHFVPIDISEGAMSTLIKSVKSKFPDLNARGLVTDYIKGIKWLGQNDSKRNFVIFLGSTIGNFSKQNTLFFLRSLWNSLNHGDLVLIGFDLKKDISVMDKAYNDSKGLTKKFNLNLLNRINKELGGNFDIAKFSFLANYNAITGAIESYLISTEEQSVFIEELGQTFDFKAWESIHTEYSYKYLDSDIKLLAYKTGYKIEKQFYDSHNYFTDFIWRVQKASK